MYIQLTSDLCLEVTLTVVSSWLETTPEKPTNLRVHIFPIYPPKYIRTYSIRFVILIHHVFVKLMHSMLLLCPTNSKLNPKLTNRGLQPNILSQNRRHHNHLLNCHIQSSLSLIIINITVKSSYGHHHIFIKHTYIQQSQGWLHWLLDYHIIILIII